MSFALTSTFNPNPYLVLSLYLRRHESGCMLEIAWSKEIRPGNEQPD